MVGYEVMAPRPQASLRAEPFHCYRMPDGVIWTEFYRVGSDYLLRFPGLADFQVSADGYTVIANPAAGTDEATVEHLHINQVLPLAMSRQGRPVFHASVVVLPGGAVAFLGQSGMGKSTLAASFALDGAEFLTDDALFVEEVDGACQVLPSHASVRLWDDSVEVLVGSDVARAGPVSYSTKTRLLAGDGLCHSANAQPLLAAYVLVDPLDFTELSIDDVRGTDRFMSWLENSFLLDIEDRELLQQHFAWTHRISSIVPTFALRYPRDYAMLAETRNAIRQHVLDSERQHGS